MATNLLRVCSACFILAISGISVSLKRFIEMLSFSVSEMRLACWIEILKIYRFCPRDDDIHWFLVYKVFSSEIGFLLHCN